MKNIEFPKLHSAVLMSAIIEDSEYFVSRVSKNHVLAIFDQLELNVQLSSLNLLRTLSVVNSDQRYVPHSITIMRCIAERQKCYLAEPNPNLNSNPDWRPKCHLLVGKTKLKLRDVIEGSNYQKTRS